MRCSLNSYSILEITLLPVSYLQAVSYSHGVILHAMNVSSAMLMRHICTLATNSRVNRSNLISFGSSYKSFKYKRDTHVSFNFELSCTCNLHTILFYVGNKTCLRVYFWIVSFEEAITIPTISQLMINITFILHRLLYRWC